MEGAVKRERIARTSKAKVSYFDEESDDEWEIGKKPKGSDGDSYKDSDDEGSPLKKRKAVKKKSVAAKSKGAPGTVKKEGGDNNDQKVKVKVERSQVKVSKKPIKKAEVKQEKDQKADIKVEVEDEVKQETEGSLDTNSEVKQESITENANVAVKKEKVTKKVEKTVKNKATKLPDLNEDDCDDMDGEEEGEGDGNEKKGKSGKKVKAENTEINTSWDIVSVLTKELELKEWAIKNTVRLLEEDNTIPFIARYRKEQTDNMEVEKLHKLKDQWEELKAVKSRIASVLKLIEKVGKLTKDIEVSLKSSQTKEEIEHIYAPFKPGSKRTYAERAKKLGLEPFALAVISNPQQANLSAAIKPGQKGVANLEEVSTGVQHIIADMFSKDKDVLDRIRDLLKTSYIILESAKAKASKESKKDKNEQSDKKGQDRKKILDESKFENYFNFSNPIKYVKPHQVMAINRGENLKILSVRVTFPNQLKGQLTGYFGDRYVNRSAPPPIKKLLMDSFEDSFKRLVEPFMVRQIRGDLTKNAEKASVEVFASNLKRLLLAPPVRGKVVLGVDPGFRNGCKYAVTSHSGQVLDTGIFYLHTNPGSAQRECGKIVDVVRKYGCETIAIGNGTACRETEQVFSDMIKNRRFAPLNVLYCIVSECGASIYSASEEAIKEFPDMDVSLRGAVSIARRLQDPLAELVKIEPKHVGVGMYQHDIPEAMMKTALDGVVEVCVSFVGVDLNVCGHSLLRRIAGMNVLKAKKVIEWREKNGGFVNREQLKDVKGLGPKTFEQCAGFVRILPGSRPDDNLLKDPSPSAGPLSAGVKRKAEGNAGPAAKKKKANTCKSGNALDMTCIHPESYVAAERFLIKLNCDVSQVGQQTVIQCVRKYMALSDVAKEATELDVGIPTMKLILDGLTQAMDHDMRQEFEKPLFKAGLTSMEDLKTGTMLTGKVVNSTHFGAFVDIGVGQDALIHTSQMPRHLLHGKPTLELGDKVEVVVTNLEIHRKRIGCRLTKLC